MLEVIPTWTKQLLPFLELKPEGVCQSLILVSIPPSFLSILIITRNFPDTNAHSFLYYHLETRRYLAKWKTHSQAEWVQLSRMRVFRGILNFILPKMGFNVSFFFFFNCSFIRSTVFFIRGRSWWLIQQKLDGLCRPAQATSLIKSIFQNPALGTSLVVQWLRLHTTSAGRGQVQSLVGELRSHMLWDQKIKPPKTIKHQQSLPHTTLPHPSPAHTSQPAALLPGPPPLFTFLP